MSVSTPAVVGGTEALHRALVGRALEPAGTPAAREEVIAELLAMSGARPEPLAAVVEEFQRRLFLRSDDVDATRGLRVAEGAQARATRPDGAWRWQARERRRRRRRSMRTRRREG